MFEDFLTHVLKIFELFLSNSYCWKLLSNLLLFKKIDFCVEFQFLLQKVLQDYQK